MRLGLAGCRIEQQNVLWWRPNSSDRDQTNRLVLRGYSQDSLFPKGFANALGLMSLIRGV